MKIDTDAVTKILEHVARTEVMPRFKNLAAGDIREKNGPNDLVTVADLASEAALTAALSSYLPGSLVVGEEAVAKDKSVLRHLSQSEHPVWVIDPIDGTYNFSHGRSAFGIYLALVQGGEVLYGWLFDAPKDRVAVAVKGEGAYLHTLGDGVKMGLRLNKAVKPLNKMRGHTGGAQSWHFKDIQKKVGFVQNIRSSLQDFLAFGLGEIDFVLHKMITPWDHTAAVVLAREVGGFVALNNKQPYTPDTYGRNVLLAAASEQAYDLLYREFAIDDLIAKMAQKDFEA